MTHFLTLAPQVNLKLHDPLAFLEHGRAACAGEDPEMFFDEDREVEAAQVCRRCPVRADCNTWAWNARPDGWWGGLPERARRPGREAEAAARRVAVAELAEAGLPVKAIAARLGVKPDVVYSDLALARHGGQVAA